MTAAEAEAFGFMVAAWVALVAYLAALLADPLVRDLFRALWARMTR